MKTQDYVVFCIDYRCNSHCTICMLDGLRKKLHPISLTSFKALLPDYEKKYVGIIFSGGEVTLNSKLPCYIAHAKDRGFRRIMIETNGRALHDLSVLERLKTAGANEFFVSFHAADPFLSRKITRRSPAYHQTREGLENLARLDLKVITNTVVSAVNYTTLPEIAKALVMFKNIGEMQFWAYVPLSAGHRELLFPYSRAATYLNTALTFLLQNSREVTVKYFPPCLLSVDHRGHYDDNQPTVVGLDQSFWKKWESCGVERCGQCSLKPGSVAARLCLQARGDGVFFKAGAHD